MRTSARVDEADDDGLLAVLGSELEVRAALGLARPLCRASSKRRLGSKGKHTLMVTAAIMDLSVGAHLEWVTQEAARAGRDARTRGGNSRPSKSRPVSVRAGMSLFVREEKPEATHTR